MSKLRIKVRKGRSERSRSFASRTEILSLLHDTLCYAAKWRGHLPECHGINGEGSQCDCGCDSAWKDIGERVLASKIGQSAIRTAKGKNNG